MRKLYCFGGLNDESRPKPWKSEGGPMKIVAVAVGMILILLVLTPNAFAVGSGFSGITERIGTMFLCIPIINQFKSIFFGDFFTSSRRATNRRLAHA